MRLVRMPQGWAAAACLAAALAIVAVNATAAETSFPYKAYVTVDDVYVRSGPGQNYYPTEKMKSGQIVEVYRHDPGGWCAIRPTEKSFCWVSSRFIDFKGDGLAVVTSENVAARVGSLFSDIRDIVQVRLHRGEVVELLEEPDRKSPPTKDERWVKVAPPSGEFRWIAARYIDPQYPITGMSNPGAVHALVDGAAANAGGTATDSLAAPTGMQLATPAPAYGSEVKPTTSSRQLTADEFRAETEAVETELSMMVVEEPTVWSFDDLKRRAESLLAQAETAVERGNARVLLSKIERFRDIKSRYDTINTTREDTERANRALAAAVPAGESTSGGTKDAEKPETTLAAQPVSASAVDRSAMAALQARPAPPAGERRFDGTGRLAEVRAPKVGSPRFALVDAQGKIRSYITPAPGVNLRRYVGRDVGIVGTRGYSPEQKAPTLTARHITVLGDTHDTLMR